MDLIQADRAAPLIEQCLGWRGHDLALCWMYDQGVPWGEEGGTSNIKRELGRREIQLRYTLLRNTHYTSTCCTAALFPGLPSQFLEKNKEGLEMRLSHCTVQWSFYRAVFSKMGKRHKGSSSVAPYRRVGWGLDTMDKMGVEVTVRMKMGGGGGEGGGKMRERRRAVTEKGWAIWS